MKTDCSKCEARKYCGTMVASTSLCKVTNTNKKK